VTPSALIVAFSMVPVPVTATVALAFKLFNVAPSFTVTSDLAAMFKSVTVAEFIFTLE
jgi:hypothetical protein